jgi:hypothetical protein
MLFFLMRKNCSKVVILKLYDPNKDNLPREGMIMTLSASTEYAAVYGGKTDRVMKRNFLWSVTLS